MRGLGYRRDPPDDRDERYSLSATPPPAQDSHLVKIVPEILDQDGMEGCVGYALAQAACVLLGAEGHVPELPSPGFIWYNSRKTHFEEKLNVGTYIRSGIKTFNTLGVCADRYWPSNELPWNYWKRPSAVAYQKAYDARFAARYQRINGVGDIALQAMAAINAGHPIVFGASVTEDFVHLQGRQVMHPPTATDKIAGGHAMCAVAYNEAGIWGPNSWGVLWGDQGWFHFSWDYFRSTFVHDIWALSFMPQMEA